MKKKSFFERLTGGIHFEEEEDEKESAPAASVFSSYISGKKQNSEPTTIPVKDANPHDTLLHPQEDEEGQLTVDIYQTSTDIVLQTMVAGVRPEDLSITITRDMITIKGRREENKTINTDDYFVRELYWGGFSRTILLPQEVEPEESEAIERHGLLVIKLPKIDKSKKTTLKIKSL
ncbi:MAG: Hsp20/alpha crystallin family protein [Candidatus Pacebacteria bacterium]|nr:Hsp20/alpha crystallin family protein [Candidatus Paceibacterota bacterium]